MVTGHSADDLLGVLCRQWADVLDRPDAGPGTDFFDAGGDSLTAMRLAIRISRQTGQGCVWGGHPLVSRGAYVPAKIRQALKTRHLNSTPKRPPMNIRVDGGLPKTTIGMGG